STSPGDGLRPSCRRLGQEEVRRQRVGIGDLSFDLRPQQESRRGGRPRPPTVSSKALKRDKFKYRILLRHRAKCFRRSPRLHRKYCCTSRLKVSKYAFSTSGFLLSASARSRNLCRV